MKNIGSSHLINCLAKQAGFMPTYWSVISLGNDLTQSEGTRVQEGQE